MRRMNWFDWTALVLLIVGGLNWGLVGFFGFNLVTSVFSATISRVIFSLVGLSALYCIYLANKLNTRAMMAPVERAEDKIRRAA